MLSDPNLQKIAEIFIGDTAGFYPYKSGLEIVNFFNDHFEFKDIYVIFLRINSRRPQNSPMRCHTEGTA